MDTFAALGDPIRRALLRRLRDADARVVDLADEHAISRPAISRHLRLLLDAGLVSATDHGRERHYRLRRDGLAPVRALLAELAADPVFAESVLDGLDLEVRRTTREHATEQAERAASADPATERKSS